MFTQTIQAVRSIAAQKSALLSGVTLVATCGISSVLVTPAQGLSFSGFGCSDNPACQSYLEFYNTSASAGIGNGFGGGSSDTWSLPATRVSSPILFDPGVPDGPRVALNVPYSRTFGEIQRPLWTLNGTASVSLETVLKFGQLKARANASVEVGVTQLNDGYGGAGSAGANAQTYLGWGDTLTVTSNNHSLGELVPFEVRLYLDRLVSASGRRVNSGAYVSANWSGSYIPDLDIFESSNLPPSNITEVTTIAYLPVGELSTIQGRLQVAASAEAFASYPDQPLDIDVSIADAFHTANYFLTPLEDGVSYTSASGKSYIYSGGATPVPTPALLPGLIGLGLNLWRKRRSEAQEKQPSIAPSS